MWHFEILLCSITNICSIDFAFSNKLGNLYRHKRTENLSRRASILAKIVPARNLLRKQIRRKVKEGQISKKGISRKVSFLLCFFLFVEQRGRSNNKGKQNNERLYEWLIFVYCDRSSQNIYKNRRLWVFG